MRSCFAECWQRRLGTKLGQASRSRCRFRNGIRRVTVEHVLSVKKYYKTAADPRYFVWLSRASRRSLTIR